MIGNLISIEYTFLYFVKISDASIALRYRYV